MATKTKALAAPRQAEPPAPIDAAAMAESIERVLAYGDLSRLDPEQRVAYLRRICEGCGLDPMTSPLQFLTLQGKTVVYATKGCAEQLRKIHGVSVVEMAWEVLEGTLTCTVKVQDAKGRVDIATGAVGIAGLKGDAFALARMKAETKAKRRATLSICGLGMLDESEVADALAAPRPAAVPPPPPQVALPGEPRLEPDAEPLPPADAAQADPAALEAIAAKRLASMVDGVARKIGLNDPRAVEKGLVEWLGHIGFEVADLADDGVMDAVRNNARGADWGQWIRPDGGLTDADIPF